MKIKENISLAEHTTFKIGGQARYFVVAETKQDIIEAVGFSKEKNLPFFILGEGSNTLALDEGYNGVVVKNQSSEIKIKDSKVIAESGVMIKDLGKFYLDNSLAGLEWAAGIPGTIGGAVYGNAQAFEGRMEHNVEQVEFLDVETGEVKEANKQECQFSEKNSIFKMDKNLIILSVVLSFKKGNKQEIERVIKEHLEARREKHPLDLASAGSVFVNLPGQEPSSALIEKAGLKGKRVGNAQISARHAGFIVNLGGAKAEDVLELIKIVKKQVKDKLNVSLKEEIQIIR